MKVKLCGFTEEKSLRAAIEAKCDFIGFVFYEKSPRYIAPEAAAALASLIPAEIKRVAVVVDPDFELLSKISRNFSPDFFQFHGSETPEFLRIVRKDFPGIKIIKALSEYWALGTGHFEDVVDFFLFDSATPGSGKIFNWEILRGLKTKKDWFLSGGLNINNIDEALQIRGAKMIDISSGIEKSRGEKSPEMILALMNKIRNASQNS
ncbi:MAG: phosphoribosylanthranilate isomerase [Alphaproteobacteria bacterium]|nr:phosphoribosylanthranilate isomerase [Alphaproteobacteria bacterium]